MPGTTTSAAEVTHISKHGFWVLLGDEELLVPFDQFPWFRKSTIEQISEVEWPTPDHLYWPALDVDLTVQSIRNPAAFPLVSGLRVCGFDIYNSIAINPNQQSGKATFSLYSRRATDRFTDNARLCST